MSINLQERLYPLREAVLLFPKQANGKRINLSTLYRYTSTGLRGVVLSSIQAANQRCITESFVAEFFERLTARGQQQQAPVDLRSAEAAGRRLRRAFARKKRTDARSDSSQAPPPT